MKLLIALALFAVAFADEIRVVQLPDLPEHVAAGISIGQLIIPNEIMEAIKVGRPILRAEALDADDGLKVNFVDTPEVVDAPEAVHFVDAPEVVDAPEAVHFVDAPEPITLGEAPLPAFETDAVRVVDIAEMMTPEAVRVADVDAVKFVDSPVAVEAVRIAEPSLPEAAAFVPEPVIIAEPPVESGIGVNFVDSPLEAAAPEPVSLPEPALPAFETAEASAPIEAVKIAVPEYNDYRGKIFDNPMLR